MTLQEKMNEIYELTGVDPDWWADETAHSVMIKSSVKDLQPFAIQEGIVMNEPHYTESKLWEMSPKRIEVKNFCTIEPTPECIEPYDPKAIDCIYKKPMEEVMTKDEWDQTQAEWNAGKYEDVVFYKNIDALTVEYVRYCQYEGGKEGELHMVKNEYLHEALADMVLWCISEGHIKKKGEVA